MANAASWNAESVLKTYILEHYPWQEVDISGIELSGSAPASAPVSILAVKAPPGRALFKLTFKDSRTILASANVKTFDRVFKSRSALPKGYVINQDDIYATLMESALIPRGSLRDEQQLVGHSLLRSVVSNAPLTNETVSASPLVKRGRRVILLVESPGFLIKAAGETRNDAPVGALVKVENLMSRKIVTGLLVDESTVRVEY
ncbi:MAG TPA: flagellar basal body P-ring formation chaperone FlgA [Nitrospirota bacterium]|nr:flagellar basal body P-ring formation chaperone FlgA [Nitrospirota bacterium]